MELSTSSSFFTKLYKARSTIIELIAAQGYEAFKYDNFGVSELQSMLKNEELDMTLTKESKKVYVKFYEITGKTNKTLKQAVLETFVEQYFVLEETLTKEDDLIIIVNEDPTDTIQNVLKHIWEQKGIYINIMSLKRLQFNVLTHSIVPKHELLTPKEQAEFYTKYNVRHITEIPEISRFDAVATAICMRPDQVCKITRPSKTAIEGVYYRNCINR